MLVQVCRQNGTVSVLQGSISRILSVKSNTPKIEESYSTNLTSLSGNLLQDL